MAKFSLIRGWLECSFDDVAEIKKTIDEHWKLFPGYALTESQAELYKNGWTFPPGPMNWISLVFYGGNLNERATQFFKDCLEKISRMELEVCGTFFVDDEEGEDFRLWMLNEGSFSDVKRSFSAKPKLID
ncbi:hypothetical protein IV454_26690 [Massilia antarctica]|uniref:Uncharacterized protein n=1 Tax=Massilia antarctica TaxID=2765360 RepID=A0AA48WCM5_9BURK|nr:hypothetical protein [Massilia antarctica]QPI49029.1 hypothetical protein IV454_26690 [Massilia antarctica]